MSAGARPRCVVCGAAGPRIELNHVAARANDRTLVLPLCVPCHAVFTDWQWRLGILRRESLEARATHSELERAWALLEGFALLGYMGAPTEQEAAWVLLGRAAGTFHKIREEQAGRHERWGPKPARARDTQRRPPAPRGAGDPQAVLEAALQSGDRWLASDPDWPEFKRHVATLAAGAAHLERVPSAWHPAIDLLVGTLGDLGAASGSNHLDASRAQRGATLVALRNLGEP